MSEVQLLLISAVSISFLHTISGPDHYLPFIALSKARGWSLSKTIFWTVVCGCGHIWSSVVLGLTGAALGWSISKLGWLEEVRGGWAGWSLLVFGLVYSLWGLRRVRRDKRHKHFDVHEDGSMYVYEHRHGEAVAPKERHAVTPWVMFIIFLLGPCEPMIPLLYYPAAKNSGGIMLLLVTVYTIFTIVTMIVMVMIGYYSTSIIHTNRLEKYMHALGGFTILLCGVGMVFLEW
jgi:uncharacterized membrane protein YqhA